MKMKHIPPLLAGIVVIATSVFEVATAHPFGDDSSYFPLQVGGKWSYASQSFPHSEQITDTAWIDGRLYFGLTIWGNTPSFWFRASNDSVFVMSSVKDSGEHLLYNFGARAGDTLNLSPGYACSFGVRVALKSTDDTVRTPAGTFAHCYHFVHLTACMDGGLMESWFARGVGRIKYSEESIMGLRIYDLVAYGVVTSIDDRQPGPDEDGILKMDLYPNPFNPTTKIGFGVSPARLSESAEAGGGLGSREVRLAVYDLLGREVAILFDGRKEAGWHEVTFDGSDLGSGVYFCRLRSGDHTISRKMLLLR
jgi:hypothetical protein